MKSTLQKFNKHFFNDSNGKPKWEGYEMIEKVEAFVKRNPNTSWITWVDDSMFSNSIIVFLMDGPNHVDAYHIPQCAVSDGISFFSFSGRRIQYMRDTLNEILKVLPKEPK